LYILPEGFKLAVASAEIKYKGRDDVGLIYCPKGADVSALFTKNVVKAAPVLYSQNILQKNNKIYALLVNSGNANACTGEQGSSDCIYLSDEVKKALNIKKGEVLLASTGVIGVRLPVTKISDKLSYLVKNLSSDPLLIEKFAESIITTDTFKKIYSIKKDNFSICGIAKGAGMINPNMATMLCFILTDAYIPENHLSSMLHRNNERTFNSICVDGDTSTNDSVFLLSSGVNEVDNLEEFESSLYEVMLNLAKMIVKDGEGATKFIKILIKNGLNQEQCKKIAESISKSLLVKTAFFGGDPNWGRLICAIGYSDETVDPQKIDIYFGEFKIVSNCIEAEGFKEEIVAEYLKNNHEITVTIDLKLGKSSWEYYTCDLTYDYVKINSEYRT
jgi:glutamate N-acetyltransferase/amino-acid N-acetyltransferase